MTCVSDDDSLSDQDISRGGAKATLGGSNEPPHLKKKNYVYNIFLLV